MQRERRPREDLRDPEAERAPERSMPPILDLQRGAGNQAVARMLAPARPPVLARKIQIDPDAYIQGLGADENTLTPAQLTRYLRMAVADELEYVKSLAQDPKAWNRFISIIRDAGKPMSERVQALRELVTSLNEFTPQAGAREPNHRTRYATTPAPGYTHTGSRVTWGTDPEMREQFVPALENLGQLPTTDSAKALPLKQVTWEQATQLFPKPLLNLLFDVRFQVENGGKTVIDERSERQQRERKVTPNEPGTLRSYHQDSHGVLPPSGHTLPKKKFSRPRDWANAEHEPTPDNLHVQAHAPGSMNLHEHYKKTSQSGAGSSIKEGKDAPTGLAEYTGTGTDTEHNTKVVFDYLNKRLYVTLTHYQYWAVIQEEGKPTFWDGGGQELGQAQGNLTKYLINNKLKPEDATMMSPWLEVLSPN